MQGLILNKGKKIDICYWEGNEFFSTNSKSLRFYLKVILKEYDIFKVFEEYDIILFYENNFIKKVRLQVRSIKHWRVTFEGEIK